MNKPFSRFYVILPDVLRIIKAWNIISTKIASFISFRTINYILKTMGVVCILFYHFFSLCHTAVKQFLPRETRRYIAKDRNNHGWYGYES